MKCTLAVFALALILASNACGVSKDTYAKLEADYQNAREETSLLDAEHKVLETQYQTLLKDRDDLQAEQTALQAHVSTLQEEMKGVQGKLEDTLTANAALEAAAQAREQALAALSADKATVQESYDTLRKAAGDLAAVQQQQVTLNASLEKLKKDITDLETQRQALIPALEEGQVICSGSMDPVVTCMDRVIWLENPQPDEIVSGAVIAFDPPSDCNLMSTDLDVAHRVIAIQESADGVQYRTKGDNNLGDDGCWVPFSRVTGLLTGLTKGFNAEMQALLEQIWPLEDTNDAVYRDMEALSAEIAVLEAEYEAANAAYYEQYSLYCSGTLLGQTCILPPDVYNVVKPLLDHSIQLYNEVSAAVDAYNDLQADYTARRAVIRTMRNQMEVLRCTKLYTCVPYPIK